MADQDPSQQPESFQPPGTGPEQASAAAQSVGSANRGRTPFRRSRLAKWLVLGLIVVLATGGYFLWSYFSVRESTDDAQVDGYIYPVSSRVGGTAVKVLVEDNQYVTAGTALVELQYPQAIPKVYLIDR